MRQTAGQQGQLLQNHSTTRMQIHTIQTPTLTTYTGEGMKKPAKNYDMWRYTHFSFSFENLTNNAVLLRVLFD